MSSAAQWANIGERLRREQARRITADYIAAAHEVDTAHREISGEDRRRLLVQTFRARIKGKKMPPDIQRKLKRHTRGHALATTGPDFFTRLASEGKVEHLVSLDTEGLKRLFGNMFAVDGEHVSLDRSDDNAWM